MIDHTKLAPWRYAGKETFHGYWFHAVDDVNGKSVALFTEQADAELFCRQASAGEIMQRRGWWPIALYAEGDGIEGWMATGADIIMFDTGVHAEPWAAIIEANTMIPVKKGQ